MQNRAIRLEVIPLDIEHPPVAGLHHDRDSVRASALAQQQLDVQAVALLDQKVGRTTLDKERVDTVGGHTRRLQRDVEVGVDFQQRAGCDDRLVESQLVHACPEAVEIG